METEKGLRQRNASWTDARGGWDDPRAAEHVRLVAPERSGQREQPLDLQFGVEPRRRQRATRYKRPLDVACALVAMVLGAPVFALVYLAVRLTSRGPAIYACERIGRNGQPFRCYKFRTMVDGADRALHLVLLASPDLAAEFEREFKLRDDPRITRVGRVLRRTSLDELPQFWNVLRGDMSVVGWRPLVAAEVGRYGEAFPVVAAHRPGITGLWQVSGRNDVTYDERVRLDVRYAQDEVGLRRDLAIIGRTVGQMVPWSGNGAY